MLDNIKNRADCRTNTEKIKADFIDMSSESLDQ